MNWKFGVGALWFYALDGGGEMSGNIKVSDMIITNSPYNAIFLIGNSISGLEFSK